MGTKFYVHEGVYSLPAWRFYELHWDGIYLDAELFDNNIPLVDQKCTIVVYPQGSYGTGQWVNVGFPTFTNGQVVRIGHQFNWPAYDTNPRSVQLSWNGNPYGMGLNTIAIELEVTLAKHYVMSWLITYALEVDI